MVTSIEPLQTDHLHALPIGHQLGEYRIERVLGSGGFGITYYAWERHLNKPVAIKEYLPNEFALRTDGTTVRPQSTSDAADYQWGLERFLDEARTLARFDHPHLNKVFRFFEDNGTAYMVLEYIEGETLSELLRRESGLEQARLRRLLEELLSGLEEVHSAGFVHRDVKPGNIMLRTDGTAVLLDFGAARQAVGQRSKSITSILTPGYAPIEQYAQKMDDVGPWSDLYALGMVSYRCISGLKDGDLLDAVSRASLVRKGEQGGDLTPAAIVGKGRYDQPLLEAIDWAIKVNEGERPQDVAALRRVLVGSRKQASVSKAAAGRPDGEMNRPERKWALPLLPLCLAASLAAIAAGVWWVLIGEEWSYWRGVGCTEETAVRAYMKRYPAGRYEGKAQVCLSAIERKRQQEEADRLAAAEKKKREAELKRLAEEKRKAEAETKRQQEEAARLAAAEKKKREAELKRLAEEKRKAEAETKRQQEEADRLAAAEKKKREAELKRLAEEKRKAEAETKRKQEEAARLAAAEKKKREAELKRLAEEKRKAEAETKRQQEEAARLAAAEKKKREAELKRLAEEKRKAEAETKRQQEEAARLAAAEKKKREAELKRLAEEKRKAEAETKRQQEEAARLAAAEKKKREAELKRLAEEKRKAEAELKRLAEEKRKVEAAVKRQQEEADRLAAAEEERKREVEQARLAEEGRKAEAEAKRKQAEAASQSKLEAERSRFVRVVGRQPSANFTDANGWTDLHYAAAVNLPSLAKRLLESGAKVDVRLKSDSEPFTDELKATLRRFGKNYDGWKRYGETPLHITPYSNAIATATLLVERGAAVNAKNDYGSTPLHNAARNNAVATATLLIERGAAVNAKNNGGATPLHTASWKNAVATATLLIERGAAVNAKNNGGETPLAVALRSDADEVAALLRRQGGAE